MTHTRCGKKGEKEGKTHLCVDACLLVPVVGERGPALLCAEVIDKLKAFGRADPGPVV